MASRAVLDLVVSLKDEASDGLGRIGGAVGGLASGALTALTVGAGAAAVGLAGIGAAGVAAASSLEQEMANTAAIMGLTGEEVAELKGLVSDLGMDPNLKVSAVEAAQAIQELGAQGLTTEQIMNGAARATVLLSNATGGDMVQSATVATDAMALWNMEAAEMEAAVNSITSVANVSKFGIEDYALALAQGGGVAASVGMEFEDFNATIAGIAPLFASGSDAGTSLKTMLQRLVPTTGPAADAFYELGLMTQETSVAMDWLRRRGIEPVSEEWNELVTQMQRVHAAESGLTYNSKEQLEAFVALGEEIGMTHSAFFDVNGEMKDAAEIAGILNDSLKDLTEEDRNRLLGQAFGTDAMRAAIGLSEMTEEQFREMQAAMGETSAADAAATRMNTFAGAMEIAGGVMEALSIQIGDALLPVLRPLVEQFSAFASTYGPVVVAYIGQLATVMGERLPAVVQQVAAAFTTFQATLMELVTGALPQLQAAFAFVQQNADAFLGALIGMGAALAGAALVASLISLGTAIAALASPIGIIVIAAGALGAAWATNFGGIQEKTAAVWAVVEPILANAQLWLATNLPIAIAALANFWNTVLLPAIQRVAAFVQANVVPLLMALASVVIAAVTKASEGLAVLWTTVLQPALASLAAFVTNTAGPALAWLNTSVVQPLVGSFGGVVAAIQSAINWLNQLAALINSIDFGVLMPGSPTPFELGIRGITDAMKELSREGAPVLAGTFDNPAIAAGGSFGGAVTINLNGATIRSEDDIDELAYRIQSVLQRRA